MATTSRSAREARRAEQAADRIQRERAEIERLAAKIREDRRVVEEIARRLAKSRTAGRPTAPAFVKPPPSLERTPEDLTLQAWHQRLNQLEPEGGVYVRVSRIVEGAGPGRGGGGHKLEWVTNLSDPQGLIEDEIERAAQQAGIAGPCVRFRLQFVSRRTKRYLAYPDDRSAVCEIALGIAPKPP